MEEIEATNMYRQSRDKEAVDDEASKPEQQIRQMTDLFPHNLFLRSRLMVFTHVDTSIRLRCDPFPTAVQNLGDTGSVWGSIEADFWQVKV